jgi:hypothetical protein
VERELFDEILALVEYPEGLSLWHASTLLLQKSYARVTHGLRIVDDEGSDVDRSKAELANNSDAKVVMEQWKESVASATTMEEMVTLSDLMFQLCSSQSVFAKPSAQAALLQDYAYESHMLSKLSDQLDNNSDHKTLCAKLAHEAKVRELISSGNVLTGLIAADTQLADMAQHTDGMSPNCDPCLLVALLRDYSSLVATTLREAQTTKAMALLDGQFAGAFSESVKASLMAQTTRAARAAIVQADCTINSLKLRQHALFANKPEHEEWLQRTSDDCVDTALMQMRVVFNEIRSEWRLSNAATAKDLVSKQKYKGGDTDDGNISNVEAMEQQLEVVAEAENFTGLRSPGIIVNIPHLENRCLTPINGLDDDDLHLEHIHIPDLDLQSAMEHKEDESMLDKTVDTVDYNISSDTDDDDENENDTKVLVNAHEDHQAKMRNPSPAGSDDAISLPQTGGGNVSSYEIDPKNDVNTEGVNAMNGKDTSTDVTNGESISGVSAAIAEDRLPMAQPKPTRPACDAACSEIMELLNDKQILTADKTVDTADYNISSDTDDGDESEDDTKVLVKAHEIPRRHQADTGYDTDENQLTAVTMSDVNKKPLDTCNQELLMLSMGNDDEISLIIGNDDSQQEYHERHDQEVAQGEEATHVGHVKDTEAHEIQSQHAVLPPQLQRPQYQGHLYHHHHGIQSGSPAPSYLTQSSQSPSPVLPYHVAYPFPRLLPLASAADSAAAAAASDARPASAHAPAAPPPADDAAATTSITSKACSFYPHPAAVPEPAPHAPEPPAVHPPPSAAPAAAAPSAAPPSSAPALSAAAPSAAPSAPAPATLPTHVLPTLTCTG